MIYYGEETADNVSCLSKLGETVASRGRKCFVNLGNALCIMEGEDRGARKDTLVAFFFGGQNKVLAARLDIFTVSFRNPRDQWCFNVPLLDSFLLAQ